MSRIEETLAIARDWQLKGDPDWERNVRGGRDPLEPLLRQPDVARPLASSIAV